MPDDSELMWWDYSGPAAPPGSAEANHRRAAMLDLRREIQTMFDDYVIEDACQLGTAALIERRGVHGHLKGKFPGRRVSPFLRRRSAGQCRGFIPRQLFARACGSGRTSGPISMHRPAAASVSTREARSRSTIGS
jgi:hypothetical protein